MSEEMSTDREGQLSKSKQMLKKCINDIASMKEKGSYTSVRDTTKIAAPKPVRARAQALSHPGNSKWFQTSPVKNVQDNLTATSLVAL
jgi:hypothetical protein